MRKKKPLDNLTRDVLAAEAAGFGPWYGRYIAAFGHTGRTETVKVEKKSIVCQICGGVVYVTNNMPRKYCTECAGIARNRQQVAARKRKRALLAESSACAASPE